jgi:hypothetical protein
MRKALLFFVVIMVLLTSCGLFRRGSGCPTNGRNIGAERVLSGDPKAAAAAKKAGKYKTDKGLSNL